MSSIETRILAALDSITHDYRSDHHRPTVWVVFAHVALNLILYRAKGAVMATNTWLSEATGFDGTTCGEAMHVLFQLGLLVDETDTAMGDYVRGRAKTTPPDNARVVSLGKGLSAEGVQVPRGLSADQCNSFRVTSGLSLSLPGVEQITEVEVNQVREWLVNVELQAPVWRRPATAPGSIARATGPQGARLYSVLLRCSNPSKPAELSKLSNINVKRTRSLLNDFGKLGLATNTPAGWTVGPVKPSDLPTDSPVPQSTPAPVAPQRSFEPQDGCFVCGFPDDSFCGCSELEPPVSFGDETDDEHAWTPEDEAKAQARIAELMKILA